MSLFGFFGKRPEPTGIMNTVAQTIVPVESYSAKMVKELDALTHFVRSNSNILTTQSYSRVRQIDDVFRPLLGYIASNGCSPEQEYLLEAMVTDYIPTAIKAYLSLSPLDRNEKTNKMLNDQFDIMLEKVYDLAHLVRQGALNELAIQTDFIDERFR